MDEFAAKVEQTLPRRQKGNFAGRGVLNGGSVLLECISIRNGHGLKEQASYQDSDSRGTGGRRYRANHAHLGIRGPPHTPAAPYALWSGFTKDSLPIGTEIDVDGYLEPQRPAARPAAMSRFRMEETCLWHRWRCFGPGKNARWARLTAGGPDPLERAAILLVE